MEEMLLAKKKNFAGILVYQPLNLANFTRDLVMQK